MLVIITLTLSACDGVERASQSNGGKYGNDTSALDAAVASMPHQLRPLYDQYGLAFVRVPTGEFTMGDVTGTGNENERPAHPLFIDEFWIGMTEVTNGQYQMFVDGGGYEDPELWTPEGWAWREAEALAEPACWTVREAHPPEMPLSCVSWYEADAFAQWLADETGIPVRLPTEAEWEKAARGPDQRVYPWGNTQPSPNSANLFGDVDGARYASLPAAYPSGASPYGAMDMAGNVWEWTSSVYADYPYDAGDGREDRLSERDRVTRGGAWITHAEQARSTARYKDDLDDWDGVQGFRLAVSP